MKLPVDARACAVRALLRLDAGEAAQAALDAVLRTHTLDPRDAALCTELFYGYLRTEIRLDALLGTLLRQPEKLPREAYCAIALAAYSLVFLQRIPPHAAVDACVRYVRQRFGLGLSRVANGVLRSLQRLGDAPKQRDFYIRPGESDLHSWARYYAMPLWIAQLWQDAYGVTDALHLMQRCFQQPYAALRVNAQHALGEDALTALRVGNSIACGAKGVAFAPGDQPATVLGRSLAVLHDLGVLSWQAAGSQEVLARIPATGGALWDACAGQGGKALALLEQGRAVSLCTDVHAARLRLLEKTASRLGLVCPGLAQASLEAPPVRQWAGDILLDVPCSGFGTLARRPEIRRRRTPQDLVKLVRMQTTMLDQAWARVSPGRQIVYMTCTLNPAENEEQTLAFLYRHKDAACDVQWQTPHDHPWLEGMFIACLRKR